MISLQRKPVAAGTSRRHSVSVKALWGRGKTAVKEAEPEVEVQSSKKPRRKETVLDALDFAQPRSKRDAELLYEARYGEMGPDGRLTPEQYNALARKIRGTYKDFFKGYVEEERVEATWTNSKQSSVPYLPVLVGILVAVLATTVVVVQKTGAV